MPNFDYTPEAEQYSPEIEKYIVEDRSPLADQYQVEILYRCNSHEVFVETLEEYFSKHSYGQSSLTVFPQETGFYITKVADGPRQCCAKYNSRTKDNNDELRRTNYNLQRELIDYKAALRAATQKAAASSYAQSSTQKLKELAQSEELAVAKADLSSLKDEFAAKSAQLESAGAELAAMRDEVAALKKKLRPLPVLVSQCQSFAAELIAKEEELEAIKAVQAGVFAAPTDPLKATLGGTSPAHPIPRVEAVKDQARCEAQAKQTGFEAIESLLGGLKGEAQAKDAEIASLQMELGAEKKARAAGEEELAVVRSALGSTQDLVKDVLSQLTAAETALASSAREGCSCSELRAVRAAEGAAARTRPETPELVSGSSSDEGRGSFDSGTLESTGGASPSPEEKKVWVWSIYTPPHLRKALRGQPCE